MLLGDISKCARMAWPLLTERDAEGNESSPLGLKKRLSCIAEGIKILTDM